MTFNETVREIKNAEKNVDKVLKAAKLQRTPKMDDDMILALIAIVGMFVLVLAMIVAMVLLKGGVI